MGSLRGENREGLNAIEGEIMNYEQVRVADILTEGPQAGRFSFSFEPDIFELARSIETNGLVNPPTVRRGAGSFDVVRGFRRVLACKRNGFLEISALVYEADELSDEKCLWQSLIDGQWAGRMSPVEQAIALGKFSEQGYDTNKLMREIAPRLGLPSARNYVENCLRLLSLDEEILRAVHSGSFGIEQAFCLYNVEADALLPTFHILRSCRANLNETRELVSLIPDVAAMKGASTRAFIEKEIVPTVGNESLPPRRKLEQLRRHLMNLRYPRLSKAESRFQTLVDEMELGESCHVSAPKYFEGNDISIGIKGGSIEQLTQILRQLCSADVEDKFRQLFSIIRGGEET